MNYQPREQREKTDVQFAQTAFGTSKLADLRKLPADQLVKAAIAKTTSPPAHFGPDVDGYFLPDTVPNIYAAGKQAQIPLLAGWNADEGRSPEKTQTTVDSFKAQAETEFGAKSADFLKAYAATSDAEAVNASSDYAGDRFIAFATWSWLEAQLKTSHAPVYRYFFTLGSPGDKFHPASIGAFHSDDIEYVFGALDSRQEAVWRPEDRKLSDQMGAYWTNFARTGDPNSAGLPTWPRYDQSGGWQVMHLDANSAAQPDDKRARYLFLEDAWTAK